MKVYAEQIRPHLQGRSYKVLARSKLRELGGESFCRVAGRLVRHGIARHSGGHRRFRRSIIEALVKPGDGEGVAAHRRLSDS